jgi:hypothetical protein
LIVLDKTIDFANANVGRDGRSGDAVQLRDAP